MKHLDKLQECSKAMEKTEAYIDCVDQFSYLFSYLMEEALELGPEGKYAVLKAVEITASRKMKDIEDDCYEAIQESIDNIE
jgi:hypothetical protein